MPDWAQYTVGAVLGVGLGLGLGYLFVVWYMTKDRI